MTSVACRHVIILALCLTSGIVDVVGYLSLGHVFTSNMTGNIVLMGLAIGHAEGFAILRSLIALVGFIMGTGFAAVIIGRTTDTSFWPKSVTAALTVEGGFLLLFAIMTLSDSSPSETMIYLLITLLSLAMGMQTTAARRLGVAAISTTVLTNNLANVIEDVVSTIRGWVRNNHFPSIKWDSMLRLAAIVIYCLGAAMATVAERSYPLAIIWVPIVLVALILVTAVTYFPKLESIGKKASGVKNS
ncbi:YoaK family protein [Paenibacillus aestuarii]|uniref:YoaK family protein n=1 Tax=Paenibacillus aestuarii TaxID=516965 RepID=A0ABW0KD65_9BACL|nr:YoaK family protein [Paenibacillus aestuarii]